MKKLFSRCCVGKARWLWVVYDEGSVYWGEEPLASGFAQSPEEAQSQAEEQVGPVVHYANHMAEGWRRKTLAIKRMSKEARSDQASTVEFVYECHQYYSDYDGRRHDSITAYRIVKRTAKRIYVEVKRYCSRHQTGSWLDYVESTFVLDRAEFEATGKARRSGKYYDDYYADPSIYHAERRDHRPECFASLGIPTEATREEIQAAYRRLARQTHPDTGGDAQQFKQVQAWYEEAIVKVNE